MVVLGGAVDLPPPLLLLRRGGWRDLATSVSGACSGAVVRWRKAQAGKRWPGIGSSSWWTTMADSGPALASPKHGSARAAKQAATALLNETSEVRRCLNARQHQLVCLHARDARHVACSGPTLELDVAFVNRCGRRVSGVRWVHRDDSQGTVHRDYVCTPRGRPKQGRASTRAQRAGRDGAGTQAWVSFHIPIFENA
jgi:hypothetical protein